MGAEADQIGLLAEFLPAKLTDIVFTAGSHLSRAGVADMRIMRPYNGFAVGAMKRQQVLQGLEHVIVAQIP